MRNAVIQRCNSKLSSYEKWPQLVLSHHSCTGSWATNTLRTFKCFFEVGKTEWLLLVVVKSRHKKLSVTDSDSPGPFLLVQPIPSSCPLGRGVTRGRTALPEGDLGYGGDGLLAEQHTLVLSDVLAQAAGRVVHRGPQPLQDGPAQLSPQPAQPTPRLTHTAPPAPGPSCPSRTPRGRSGGTWKTRGGPAAPGWAAPAARRPPPPSPARPKFPAQRWGGAAPPPCWVPPQRPFPQPRGHGWSRVGL